MPAIRNTSYKNYGLTDFEAKVLLVSCQLDSFQGQTTLFRCALEVNEPLAEYLYDSITMGISYEKMTCKKYIPASKNDFYGYRRKCLALYKERTK